MAIDKTHFGKLIDSISMDNAALEDSMDMDNDGVGRRAHEVDDLELHDILDLGDKGKEAMQTHDVTDPEQSNQHIRTDSIFTHTIIKTHNICEFLLVCTSPRLLLP